MRVDNLLGSSRSDTKYKIKRLLYKVVSRCQLPSLHERKKKQWHLGSI